MTNKDLAELIFPNIKKSIDDLRCDIYKVCEILMTDPFFKYFQSAWRSRSKYDLHQKTSFKLGIRNSREQGHS